jgi:two-component system response regulator YesN
MDRKNALGRQPEAEVMKSIVFRRALRLDQRIEAVVSAIQRGIAGELELEKLARQANISSSHLRHLFKLETGFTFNQYVKLVRMQQAERLLRTTFLSVKEIMNRVGIGNESYFSREFKKAHGLAPGKYRASYRRKSKTAET